MKYERLMNASSGQGKTGPLAGCVLVVIPAYEEEGSLPGVLDRLPPAVSGLPVRVLVVDDGSGDRTAEIAREHGAIVERFETNRGGGAALRAGFELAMAGAAEIVVTMDADGQHLPEEIEALVAPVAAGRADLVVGSRVLGAAEPNTFARDLGIAFFNRLISLLMRRRIGDCSNGYRALRTDVLRSLDLRQQQFHTSEFLIQALARGVEVVEVPVTVARRSHGTTKKPRALRYGFGFARAIVLTWLRTLPLRVERPSRRNGRTLAAQEPPAPGSRDA
jgi:glycosyltransferase involved in cell wall biosynthesis